MVGNQLSARYKLLVGRRMRSATVWPMPSIRGWTRCRRATRCSGEPARHWAGACDACVRARRTGRTLRVEVEGLLNADTALAASDQIGRSVAAARAPRIPEM